jgi:hypothetical protein
MTDFDYTKHTRFKFKEILHTPPHEQIHRNIVEFLQEGVFRFLRSRFDMLTAFE